MKENKIPTAEEFLKTQFKKGNSIETYDLMIEFAKLHVEAALQSAAENSDLIETDGDVDKSTILNAYPLDNIK